MSNLPITHELDHNVYILGAGFSVDGGLPLVDNFLQTMAECLEGITGTQRQGGEIEAIQRVFEFRLRAASAAYRADLNVENIEELFSLASATGSVSNATRIIVLGFQCDQQMHILSTY